MHCTGYDSTPGNAICEHGHGWCLTTWLVESPSAFLSLREKKVKRRNRRHDKTNQNLRPQILSYTRTTCNSFIMRYYSILNINMLNGMQETMQTTRRGAVWVEGMNTHTDCFKSFNTLHQHTYKMLTTYLQLTEQFWRMWAELWSTAFLEFYVEGYNYKVSNNAWKV